MKKTIQIIAMAMLCLFLSNVAYTQTAALKIGDKVPDVTINNITNYKTTSTKLSDFKGKLLILDFWATWCSPCISMAPKLESLQRQFGEKIQIVPVTYQSKATVEPVLKRIFRDKAMILPEVTSDKVLHNLFPHKYLPHYVWINAEGIVVNITSYQDVTVENIETLLKGRELHANVKQDKIIKYDRSQPILLGPSANGTIQAPILYSSAFAAYISGVTAEYKYLRNDSSTAQKVLFHNCNIFRFYQAAYSRLGYFQRNRVAYEVMDSAAFFPPKGKEELENWRINNLYNYELIVPKAIGDDMFKVMQLDGGKFFPQYSVAVENRPTRSLVLIRTSATDKLATKGGAERAEFTGSGARLNNFPLIRLVAQLNLLYMQSSPLPIIDETNYTGRVDLVINGNLGSVEAINLGLARYDLQFVEKDAMVPILVIRDNKDPLASVTK